MKFPSTAYVHKVPEGLAPEEAVFCVPLSCSVHAVERATVKEGDVVVVSGIGNLFCSLLQHLTDHGKRVRTAGLRGPCSIEEVYKGQNYSGS